LMELHYFEGIERLSHEKNKGSASTCAPFGIR